MPYIQQDSRRKFDEIIQKTLDALEAGGNNAGEINYLFSSILWKIFEKNKSYATANNLIGALECMKLELYRRKISPYENLKVSQNGDVI